MSKFIDLKGMKFGELKVLSYDEDAKNEKKYSRWICECSCGKILTVRGTSLRNGKAKDCHGVVHSKFVGKRFGKLVVQPDFRKGKYHRQYLCKCDCGNSVYIDSSSLLNGNTKSCGCINRELVTYRNTTHGMSKERIYSIWAGMISRCENPGDSMNYMNYGGRGISVCKEWSESFMSFYTWSMEHGYAGDLSIDRIDNDGDYCPENCRWTTVKEQARNRRSNINVEYKGEVKTLKQWSEEYGVEYSTLHSRYKYLGWDFEKALLSPVVHKVDGRPRKFEVNGESHTISEWAKITGLDRSLIDNRIYAGWDAYEAITKPPRKLKKKEG